MAEHPQVDFDCDDRGVTLYTWLAFWDSTRKRYVGDVTYWAPKLNDASVSHVEHPFSYFGGDEEGMAVLPLSGDVVPRIAFAQDSLQQTSDEYKILQLLIKESSLQSLEGFNGVLPPLDLVDLGDHCIVVMPRWGEFAYHPWFSTIREAVDYMRYWLKGLSFLHKHHIVHRDIKPENILVNHFAAFSHIEWNEMRRTLRRDGHLAYAIIDFDISIMFPPTATREECRLPSNLSWDGAYDQPHDTKQGELDYDPFAFDVGCLGILFCERFQHFTRTVPMFAPLMDRMTTRDLSRRLTASQALDFLESFASELTQEQLQLPAPPRETSNLQYEDYDRWEGLPDKFMKDWGHFREPKPSFQIILVRQICDYAWGYKLVQWLRRIHRFWKSSHF
ncbi:kinase-like domain-containing protein [Gautieria morchelliformis]|nr:kinase-like domain-containing protein [Gautieria morchelliformis]